MVGAIACCELSALLSGDPTAQSDEELKQALHAFERTRGRFAAAEARWIAEFDQRCGFVSDGAVNTASWLAHHTGVPRAVAGGRALLAKRLRRMPVMAAALAQGRVGEAHARALGRCLTPRTVEAFARDEAMLVEQAQALEADDFEVVVSQWLQLNDVTGPDPGAQKPSELHFSPMLEGRHRLDGELDLADSAEFAPELDAIYDELWRADQNADESDPTKHRSPAERRAAALVEMARRSSAAGDRDDDPDEPEPAANPKRGPRRAQFIAVLNLDKLAAAAHARHQGVLPGDAWLEDGTIIPMDLLDLLACDAGWARVLMAGTSAPVDLGKLTYSPSPAQRRALIGRDRGCIVPGCRGKPRWCDAHHVIPFPHGSTNLSNLVLVCRRHHKQIHANAIKLVRDPTDQHWEVRRPDGTKLFQRPPPPRMVA